MKLPEGWKNCELGDIATFSGGSQPPRATFKYAPEEGYIRLLQIRDYKTDNHATYIPKSLAKKFCTEQDIMIGRYGPPVFQILRGLAGAYNVALMKASPTSGVSKDYLYYFLQLPSLFLLIDQLSRRSAGQSGVDMEALRSYPVNLTSPQIMYQPL